MDSRRCGTEKACVPTELRFRSFGCSMVLKAGCRDREMVPDGQVEIKPW